MNKGLRSIELFAGTRPDGQPIVEELPAVETAKGDLRLVRSPAFAKGLASGDKLRLRPETQEVELLERSGNLSIRVYTKGDMAALADYLVPALEKLGGELDLHNERMLVFSIHVSCGFASIESLLEDAVAKHPGAAWLYGNVYHPADGVTPLNWWQTMLSPE